MALDAPQNITIKDFGAGMDQKSSENAIKPGYSERLTNVVTNSNGALSKRAGYEGYYGWLPLRVKSVQRTSGSDEIKLFFDSAVSLRDIVATPVVVYGHLSEPSISGADFESGTDHGHYYSTFSNSIPYTFAAPSGNTGGINGLSSVNVMTMTMRATSPGSSSSDYMYIDTTSISTSGSNDITYSWSGLASDIDVFLPSELIGDTSGEEYVWNYTTGSDPHTETLSAATHQLENFTPIVQVYVLNGSNWEQATPGTLTIDNSTGEISHTTNGIAGGTSMKVLFKTADFANISSSNITTSGDITFTTSTDFFFASAYVASGSDYELIVPDSIVRDDSAGTITFSFSDLGGTETIYAVYTAAEIQDNFLTLIDSSGDTTENYTDTNPQMTLWGIPHNEIYFGTNTTAANVTHIDSYRAEAESRIVSGITGIMTKACTRAESDADYQIGSTTVSLDDRVNATVTIGPVFSTTAETSSRTNGMVKDDTVEDNKALVTAVEYVSSGVSKYTLSLPSPTGSLETAISVTSGLEDYLTVTGMANSIHNGTFKITARDNTAKTITVSNSKVTSARYDESGARGRAGVFTDRFDIQNAASFIPNDLLTIDAVENLDVLTTSSATVVVENLDDYHLLNQGTRVYATRTTALLPVASTDDFVLGDMCTVTGYDRKFRVVGLNTSSASGAAITSVTWSSTTATVVAAANPNLRVGQKVNILRTSDSRLNGTHTITSIISTTSFTITTTYTGSTLGAGGVIQGKTIELDESIEIYDANEASTLSVIGRWCPIEAPTTSYTLPSDSHYQYFTANTYTAQPRIKSTIINDNMYLTNYDDAAMKFDGTNIYKAGLPYWQAQHMVATATTTSSISLSNILAAVDASTPSGTVFTVALGAQSIFVVGDYIVHTDDNAVYEVLSLSSDGTYGYVGVSATISGASSGNIRLASRFKYYVRLNAIDANGNIVASAATGLNDYVVNLTAAGVINHKFIGLPSFDLYDYDNITIEVYRTKAGKSAPYYKIGATAINFDAAKGYLTFQDATDDSLLSEFDAVNTALLGTEVGTGFAPPSRAKYITSASNRLLYMNTQTYPYINLAMLATDGFANVTFSDFNSTTFLIRKDNTDSSSTSNMIDRAKFRFKTSTTTTVSTASAISATSFTLTLGSIGSIAVGDWVYLLRTTAASTTSSNKQLRFAGWYQVNAIDTNDITCKGSISDTGAFVANTDVTHCVWADDGEIPVYLGADYNLNTVDGNDDNLYQVMVRLAAAINASQAMVDRTITGYEDFTPWISAQAGSTIGAGRINLRQDLVLDTTVEVVLPSITGASWYAFDQLVSGTDVQARTTLYPSRVIVSYPEYPEMFDSPEGGQSTQVIDVNAADGQEITGGIPFFTESAFGQAQNEALIVVFKENSIYLLDINTGSTQKIQSRGLGCTAPASIAATKDGINFANNSGVYRLNRNLTISFVGEYIDRIYQDEINKDQLDLMTGTHYAIGSQYKLSAPVNDDTVNSRVLVYDYQREGKNQEYGAWTEFTNHAATGWANLENDAFFATSTGEVFRLRNAGDETDFRDDADAVDTMTIILRAEDFDISGERKVMSAVNSHFEMRFSDNVGTTLSVAYDLQSAFEDVVTFNFTDADNIKVKFAEASLPRRKSVYFQMKYTNNTKDESVILAGVDYSVAKLSHKGVKQVGS